MPTTTRLGLRKPDGTDLVSRVNDLNNNWDIVDAKAGTVICTSSTRPTGGNLYDGCQIYETDTKNIYVYNAASTTWRPVAKWVSTGIDNCYVFSITDNMDIVMGSRVVTTNGSGDVNLAAQICTATGWSQVYRMVYSNGDQARVNMVIAGAGTTLPSSSGLVRCYTGNTAAVIASTAVRIEFVAIGK